MKSFNARRVVAPIVVPAVVAIAFLLAFAAPSRGGLTAEQIVLIVNSNVPDSAQLAEFYARARDIPNGRIIALDLPSGDVISFDQYERQVVPQVRDFLETNQLTGKVTCAVTMYGVPLRIAGRENSPDEQRELAVLKAAAARAEGGIRSVATEVERQAAALDPAFRPMQAPPQVSPIEAATRRLELATQAVLVSVQRIGDATERDAKANELANVLERLREVPKETEPATRATTGSGGAGSGGAGSSRAGSSRAGSSSAPSAAGPQPASEAADVESMSGPQLVARRFDPRARKRLRELAAREGLVAYGRALAAQIDYLSPDATEAAFDNELAMLWWSWYARPQWAPNALHYRLSGSRTPPMLMVSRLDGPSVQSVRDIIATSVQVEKRGLSGRVVIDAGGAAKFDPQHKQPGFWPFDRTFTNLMLLLRKKGGIDVTYDDGAEVLPPHSVKGVAIYSGWYSVGNYVPACDFGAGAVGYHVASYEMTSLHDANNKGWCRGLIGDGVVATLGPVSEPYLHAFPTPDEFFPLLMTGKLTLAEVYWRTNPLASWKMCLVGDPLYTPYKVHPPLDIPDLPDRLRGIFETPAQPSRPSSATTAPAGGDGTKGTK